MRIIKNNFNKMRICIIKVNLSVSELIIHII